MQFEQVSNSHSAHGEQTPSPDQSQEQQGINSDDEVAVQSSGAGNSPAITGATAAPEAGAEMENISPNDGENEAPTSAEALGEDIDGSETSEKKSYVEIPVSQPAKIESQEDLDHVAALHQEWIASVLNPRAKINGSRANLRGAMLSGLSLVGVDLRGANFSHATLHGTDLSKAILSGCNFIHADLQGAILNGARVRKANFQFADLRDADLDDVNLDDAIFVTKNTKEAQHKHEVEVELPAPADPTNEEAAMLDQDPSA